MRQPSDILRELGLKLRLCDGQLLNFVFVLTTCTWIVRHLLDMILLGLESSDLVLVLDFSDNVCKVVFFLSLGRFERNQIFRKFLSWLQARGYFVRRSSKNFYRFAIERRSCIWKSFWECQGHLWGLRRAVLRVSFFYQTFAWTFPPSH